MLDQNVAQKVDQNVQAKFRRLFLYKPMNSRTLSRVYKAHVTSNGSLTNHPKLNKRNILMIRMSSSAHVYFMNSTVGEKQKAKGNLVLLNQR